MTKQPFLVKIAHIYVNLLNCSVNFSVIYSTTIVTIFNVISYTVPLLQVNSTHLMCFNFLSIDPFCAALRACTMPAPYTWVK